MIYKFSFKVESAFGGVLNRTMEIKALSLADARETLVSRVPTAWDIKQIELV